ncbi:1-acyl-sn-glycerol-3-phosphate acyltransferase [bacterium]|nr:1-acyl-sn-glycerol-3-phosphate acyltransferase [bacterium]MBY0589580.1 1-acyl-sn-glycerol-3-phosphate acyltransferase [bacterium]
MRSWWPAFSAFLERAIPWLVYQAIWQTSMLVGLFFVRLRVSGVSCFPARGSVLLLSNHQSFLDPPFIGVSIPRQARYAARSSLFQGSFSTLITHLGAIALDREGSSGKGLRESLRALGDNQALIYFPEGTRTLDGQIGSLQRGTGLLIRRSGSKVILAGIAGAYEAWPRRFPIPRRGVVWIHFEAWSLDESRSNRDEDILISLTDRMNRAFAEANRRRAAFLRCQKVTLVGK